MGHTETTTVEKSVSKSGNDYSWNLLGVNYSFHASKTNLYSDDYNGSHSTRGDDQTINPGRDYTEDYGNYADGVYVENEKTYSECVDHNDYSEYSESEEGGSHSDHDEYFKHVETHVASKYVKHADEFRLWSLPTLTAKTAASFPNGNTTGEVVLDTTTQLYISGTWATLVGSINPTFSKTKGSSSVGSGALAIKVIDRLVYSGDEFPENYHSEYESGYSDNSSYSDSYVPGQIINELYVMPNPCDINNSATLVANTWSFPISFTYEVKNASGVVVQSGNMYNEGGGTNWSAVLNFDSTGTHTVTATAQTAVNQDTKNCYVTVEEEIPAAIESFYAAQTTVVQGNFTIFTLNTTGTVLTANIASDAPDVEAKAMTPNGDNCYEAAVIFDTIGTWTVTAMVTGAGGSVDTANVQITVEAPI
ncbi:hypothetical protein HNP86_001932 [Methanococcus maripaludis]|uniref:Uncharacterized protein n=1 Tax=Methanococcus maripaludis TaxID=39152 RepID=A0A7J9NXN1_METMI|nr:hypothetical protein [Methanococcus maripaludis]MBA2851773.1 hypothetical protein [Methanococcus maripaludis]